MTAESIRSFCLQLPYVYEDHPFGNIPVCYKLNKKVFAQLYPNESDFKLTLKCSAEEGEFFCQAYPGKVIRGYHCPPIQQPYFNTIILDDFPEEELFQMVQKSYETVFKSFPKKVRDRLLEKEPESYATDVIGKKVTVTVDRPMGSCHPEHPEICYPVNYGYIKGIMANDGEEQDAYILGLSCPVREFTGTVIAVVHRYDDVEEKWVVAPNGVRLKRKDIKEQIHFQEQYFDSEIIE